MPVDDSEMLHGFIFPAGRSVQSYTNKIIRLHAHTHTHIYANKQACLPGRMNESSSRLTVGK